MHYRPTGTAAAAAVGEQVGRVGSVLGLDTPVFALIRSGRERASIHGLTTMDQQADAGDSAGLDTVLQHFPPVSFAMAYGSGVFHQAGYSAEQQQSAMIDLVFAVDDPVSWHRENLRRHRDHYSSIGALGAQQVASVQVLLLRAPWSLHGGLTACCAD